MIYYLYVKTHNQTGLKYLGQTQQNPFQYKGSGFYWKRHIKKYGNDVTTEIIAAVDNLEDLIVAGRFWTNYWNVVISNDWANLMEESGHGGGQFSQETIQKLQNYIPWNKGKKLPPLSLDHRQKISQSCKGKGVGPRKPHSLEHRLKLSKSVSEGMKKSWLSRQSRYGEESPPCK